MKKALSLLLAVLLMISMVPFASADVSTSPVNFGDFSMAIDPFMAINYTDRVDYEIWFTLYPAYNILGDKSTSFNVVWYSYKQSISELMEDGGQSLIDDFCTSIRNEMEINGFTVKDIRVPAINVQTLDGLEDLAAFIVSEVEMNGIHITVYELWVLVSGPFGTYEFTGGAGSMEMMENYIYPLFGAITWND